MFTNAEVIMIGQRPQIRVTIAGELPDLLTTARFDAISVAGHNATLYYAALTRGPWEGLGHQFFHIPQNETGFGGQTFDLMLMTGERRTIRGPWSGTAAQRNAAAMYGPHVTEVVFVGAGDLFEHGYLSVRRLAQLGVRFEVDIHPDRVTYRPHCRIPA